MPLQPEVEMRVAGWIEAERGRFILFLPVVMGAAILIYFDLPAEPPLWLAGVMPTAAGFALLCGWRWPVPRFAAALLLAGAMGFGRAEWRTAAQPGLMTVPYGAPVVSGRVVSVDPLPVGRRITLQAPELGGGTALARDVRIRLRNDDPATLEVGDTVSLRAELFRQERPAFPGAWDAGRQNFFARLGASGFALGNVTVTGTAPRNAPGGEIRALRETIARHILEVLPVSTGSIAVTLLTGFEQVIPEPERQAFIAAGLAHILAVAGLHVSIVMGLCFGAMRSGLALSERAALHLPVKALAAAFALAGGVAYAALTGAHLPILRSLAMASLVTLGVLAGRRAISLRGLALAAAVLMLTTPEAVIGVSFQMSFSAVLALIAGYAAAQGRVTAYQARTGMAWRFGSHVLALAFTSLLAGGASMPYAAYQFQQIQPYWILANLLAVPLTALWIMPLGLLALVAMPFGLESWPLAPMGWGIRVIVWVTRLIARWPDAMLPIVRVPDLAILCFTAGLVLLCLLRSRVRLGGLACMAAGLVVYAAARPPDVLVSADARLIAVRRPADILLMRAPRAEGYTLASWTPVWGGRKFSMLDPANAPAGVICDREGCRMNSPAVYLALSAPRGGCGAAAVVVSAEPLRGACGSNAQVVIDRFSVWRDGAVALWIGPTGVRLQTDRQVQGSRPWVTPWPDQHQASNTTLR